MKSKLTILIIFAFVFTSLSAEKQKESRIEQAIREPKTISTNGVPNNYASPGRAKHDKGPPPGQAKEKPKPKKP